MFVSDSLPFACFFLGNLALRVAALFLATSFGCLKFGNGQLVEGDVGAFRRIS